MVHHSEKEVSFANAVAEISIVFRNTDEELLDVGISWVSGVRGNKSGKHIVSQERGVDVETITGLNQIVKSNHTSVGQSVRVHKRSRAVYEGKARDRRHHGKGKVVDNNVKGARGRTKGVRTGNSHSIGVARSSNVVTSHLRSGALDHAATGVNQSSGQAREGRGVSSVLRLSLVVNRVAFVYRQVQSREGRRSLIGISQRGDFSVGHSNFHWLGNAVHGAACVRHVPRGTGNVVSVDMGMASASTAVLKIYVVSFFFRREQRILEVSVRALDVPVVQRRSCGVRGKATGQGSNPSRRASQLNQQSVLALRDRSTAAGTQDPFAGAVRVGVAVVSELCIEVPDAHEAVVGNAALHADIATKVTHLIVHLRVTELLVSRAGPAGTIHQAGVRSVGGPRCGVAAVVVEPV